MKTPITNLVEKKINNVLDWIEARTPRFLWVLVSMSILFPGMFVLWTCILLDKLFSQKN